MKSFLVFACLLVTLLPGVALAQDQPNQPTPTPDTSEDTPLMHVIQEGESLFSIAAQYETTVEALQLVNSIADPALIFAGQELIIPGAEGSAVFTTHTVQLGDRLSTLALAFATTPAEIAADNRLVHPDSLYAGQPLSLVSYTGSGAPKSVTGVSHEVQPGETLLSIAAQYGISPAELVASSGLSFPARVFPGMRLRVPTSSPYQELSDPWLTVQTNPAPWLQGDTVSIYVETESAAVPQGSLGEQAIQFAPYQAGYAALVGIDAFTEPGLYTLELASGAGEDAVGMFQQKVAIRSANFPTQSITVPETLDGLLDPALRANEDAFLATIYEQFSAERYWEDLWQSPVSTTIVTAEYGGARSYNGGPFSIYHSGIDFSGIVGTPIEAPANGAIIFTGPLELRGNTIIVDHGMGVMTGYYHLSQMLVTQGDQVTKGQVIGLGGSSGLSTGPHLHWDVRVSNVPVNGNKWLLETFP